MTNSTQTLFVKWLKSNKDNVEQLLAKAKQGKLKSSEYSLLIYAKRAQSIFPAARQPRHQSRQQLFH